MDFSNRNVQTPAAAPGSHATAPVASPNPNNNKKGNSGDDSRWVRIAFVTMIAAIVVLLVGAIATASTSNKSTAENEFIDSTKLQAVFLNTNQVYFGKITKLNNKYVVLKDIYYIQASNTDAKAPPELIKLGCELHQPLDQLVINRDQVSFWENLGYNGQVAKGVAQFKQQNPEGLKCVDQSKAANSSSSSTQPATTTPADKKQ